MPGKNTIILLADDDAEDKEILEESILSLAPHTAIRSVSNGQQAVEYLAGCQDADLPSLIVLDYKMPILGAVEVLKQIHHNVRYSPIPKVVWSSSRQPEHVKKCMENGAIDYFVKPNKAAELNSIALAMLAICNNHTA